MTNSNDVNLDNDELINSQNGNNGNDVSKNTSLVIDAINYLQTKNKGRYYENVVERCKSYDWDKETIETNIKLAISSGKVIEKVFNSQPSLRVIKDCDINVIIQDPVENATTNTLIDYTTSEEFTDFKKYVESCMEHYVPRSEINTLKEDIKSNSYVHQHSPGDAYLAKYITCLESRNASLERQNEFDRKLIENQQMHITNQQQTIEKFIHQPQESMKYAVSTDEILRSNLKKRNTNEGDTINSKKRHY